MKKWNKNERWELAIKLEGIIGADIDLDEEEALRDAIRLVCPEFAEMRDEEEREVVEWFENTTDEEKELFVQEEMRKMEEAKREREASQIIKAEIAPWAENYGKLWRERRQQITIQNLYDEVSMLTDNQLEAAIFRIDPNDTSKADAARFFFQELARRNENRAIDVMRRWKHGLRDSE